MAIINVEKLRREIEELEREEFEASLLDITITDISNVIKVNGDFTAVTVYTGQPIVITGTLDIPDTEFSLPISKNGKVAEIFTAEVKDGIFTSTIIFDNSGQYTYTNADANLDLPEQLFKVAPIIIDVRRDMR